LPLVHVVFRSPQEGFVAADDASAADQYDRDEDDETAIKGGAMAASAGLPILRCSRAQQWAWPWQGRGVWRSSSDALVLAEMMERARQAAEAARLNPELQAVPGGRSSSRCCPPSMPACVQAS
jgi:hypothetical protein